MRPRSDLSSYVQQVEDRALSRTAGVCMEVSSSGATHVHMYMSLLSRLIANEEYLMCSNKQNLHRGIATAYNVQHRVYDS